MRFSTSLVLQLLSATALVHALPKVNRGGRYLYSEDGTRFYIKGVAYQEQGALSIDENSPFSEPTEFFDPLADANACTRDVPVLQELGVNTIRVYSVDSANNHDDCMQLLNDAGIYTIIDLSLPVNGSLDRSSPSWTTNLLNLYIRTIDTFAKYDNVLAYNVGNEVVTSSAETVAAPFIKAAARDIKAYLRSKDLGNILVGYAAIDGDATLVNALASYLSCDSEETALDLFGLNNYRWCGDDSFESAYAGIMDNFANYNIPAYFSEYGCNTSPPRLWTEVAALFSTQMSDVWSGGLAFSYFPAQSDAGEFGMVTIDGDTVTRSEDFTRLAEQYQAATGPNTPSQGDAGATSYPACPAQDATFLATTSLPPTPNDAACNCVVDTLSCQFTPQTTNTSGIVGELLNTGCSLVGTEGESCNDIASSGSSGEYGRLSYCSPEQKLSFVMTQFYEATSRNPASCDFAGNATINSNAPSSTDALNDAVSQCLQNAAATFTPTAPAEGGGGGSSNGNGATSPANSNAAVAHGNVLFGAGGGVMGIGMMMLVAVATGFWTLA